MNSSGRVAWGSRYALADHFDRRPWRPDTPQAIAAALVVTFAVAASSQGTVGRLTAIMLAADVTVQLLPWRLPRSRRSPASLWAEAALSLSMPAVFAVIMLFWKPQWVHLAFAPVWLTVAVASGAVLLWLGGMPLAGLVSGALAAVAKPIRPAHKGARVTSATIAPVGEEFLFRGPVLAVPHATALLVGLIGGVAFVARHHIPRGMTGRTTGRGLVTQVAAAGLLLGLTLGSHSLIPALVAHLLNNAPSIALEAMRPVTPKE